MSKVKIFICAIAIVLLSSIYVSAQKKCMFVAAVAGEENAEYDKNIIPHLESWGYVIEKHDSKNLPNYTEKDYEPYDFIFLSETTNSTRMAPLKSIPKPMLVSDGWGAKESSLAFGSGEPVGIIEPATPVVFLESGESHQLAAGYTPGTQVELGNILDPKDPCLIVWAKPSIPVIPIAGVAADSTKLVVYGIEKGTKNALDEVIKNRVVVVGVHAWGYDDLSEAGLKLFKAGIDWVLDKK